MFIIDFFSVSKLMAHRPCLLFHGKIRKKKILVIKGRGLDPLKFYRYINGNELHKKINCHKLIYLGAGTWGSESLFTT